MEPIKLVIWDLDETFWKGTLSEDPIEYLDRNQNIVMELSRRGIVNSICSKNNHDEAVSMLREKGIFDFFVFTHIDWLPKGPAVKQIIDDMQLRPENVLFLDDNHLNLEEARYFAPGIQTAHPDILENLLAQDAVKGKADRDLTRLEQYRILEKKVTDRTVSKSSNEEFLRSCRIKVHIGKDCVKHKERILELINRTNQLNFTKRRTSEAELDRLLRSPQNQTGFLNVSDRYGDYGLSGFYSLQGNRLMHFLFSCRIMDMGIEQWFYRKLGCPALEIRGDVATPLSTKREVDWIEQIETDRAPSPETGGKSAHIFVKGGCDLEQTASYLKKYFAVQTEFNYPSEKGLPIHTEHTEILKRCSPETLEEFGEVIDRVAFLDRNAFTTGLLEYPGEAYIYSVLMDLTQGLYRYRETDLVVPYGDLLVDLTQPGNWPRYFDKYREQGLTEEFLTWFGANFHFLGGLDEKTLRENLSWLRSRLPSKKALILINASEVIKEHPIEIDRWRHYRTMNAVVDDFVGKQPDVYLCDVRKFVRTEKDVTDNIRHYHRKTYLQIAREVKDIIEKNVPGCKRQGLIEKIKDLF